MAAERITDAADALPPRAWESIESFLTQDDTLESSFVEQVRPPAATAFVEFSEDEHAHLPVWSIHGIRHPFEEHLPRGHYCREVRQRHAALRAAAATTRVTPCSHGKKSKELHLSNHTFGRLADGQTELPLMFHMAAARSFVETNLTVPGPPIPGDFMMLVEKLCRVSIRCFDSEAAREESVHPCLKEVLMYNETKKGEKSPAPFAFEGRQHSVPAARLEGAHKEEEIEARGFRTDAHVSTFVSREETCGYAWRVDSLCALVGSLDGRLLAIIETKNELSSSGCAADQLGAYYLQHVVRNAASSGSMPLLLVAVAGCTLQVLAGCTHSHPQVDALSHVQVLSPDRSNDCFFESVQLLWALRESLHVISARPTLTAVGHPFPCVGVARDALGLPPETRLRVVQKLSGRVFRVLFGEETLILKFSKHYALDCHDKMAELGMAPRIIHRTVLLGRHILLMEDLRQHWTLEEVMARSLNRVHGLHDEAAATTTLQSLLDKVHEAGFVFGDLSRHRIMCRLSRVVVDGGMTSGVQANDFKLIGFVQSGGIGDTRPTRVLSAAKYPPMHEDHYDVADDRALLAKICGQFEV